MTGRVNLVILRCGRGSLHPHWLGGARNWDFLLCPYQEIPADPASILPPEVIEGQKWSGLFRLLSDWAGWRQYEYIWLPDDDLLADAGTINRLFELSAACNANISAPALSEDSYFSHPISMKNFSCAARAVSFIEIMMPCFKRQVLEQLLPTIGESKTGFGWGLDYVWAHLLRYRGLMIFDSITVRHTRLAGVNLTNAVVIPGQAEMQEMVSRAGAEPYWKTLGGYDEDGNYRAAEDAGFAADYLAGYAYLNPGRPELAGWLAARQGVLIPGTVTKAGPRLVVALRTHVWNRHVAEMARRLAAAAQGVHFVILADETMAAFDTAPFAKLAHTDDFSPLGLPRYPRGRVLWYNADYPLYLLREHFPAATHFAMVEYDVGVNIDLAALMRYAQAAGIDLLAHNFREPLPDWAWTKTAVAHFTQVLMAFFPLLVISARGIDHLLTRRLEICRQRAPVADEDWPFCEAFIPSAIAALPDAKIEGLDGHAGTEHYRVAEPKHLNEAAATEPGTIAHPVLGGAAFAATLVNGKTPEDIFEPGSELRRRLAFCEPEDFVIALLRRLRAQPAPPAEARIAALAAELGWPAALLAPNRALNRPATQSSVSAWSNCPAPEADARGANNGRITGGAGFHTAFEDSPWWQVDLGADFAVARAVVFNRMDLCDRCTRFSISGSSDGQNFTLRAAKLDAALFGGLDGKPYVMNFSPPFTARFIRLTLIGENFLHLDEIEIYGEPA
jgi:hypothetical protein